MKVCPGCKYSGNDNEVYCVKCGTPLEEQGAEAPQTPQMPPFNPYVYPQQPKEDISVGKWVLYHLIPCIPFVGGLVYFIMLFVWGFSSDKNKTFQNWAKAQLIMMAISLGLVVLFFVFLFVILGVTAGEFFSEFYY